MSDKGRDVIAQIHVKGRNGWYTIEDYSILSELLPKDRIYKTKKLE